MESTEKIKQTLAQTDWAQLPSVLEAYHGDTRSTVQKLVQSYEKKYQSHLSELARIKQLNSYEDHYYETGLQYIAGIDEVGRGPFAGPVVACAVVLPKDSCIVGVNDSKKLSPAKREALYQIIQDTAIAIGIGVVEAKRIDEINILQATYEAMQMAIEKLSVVPDILLNDAVSIPHVPIAQHPIIKGDEKSISIAAASIIAKVTRDGWMTQYAELYPQYDFENNKGYGTQKHIEAIEIHGLTPIHRRSFVRNISLPPENPFDETE